VNKIMMEHLEQSVIIEISQKMLKLDRVVVFCYVNCKA